MESERDAAKQSVTSEEQSDPELGSVLQSATRFQLEIVKENNAHAIKVAAGQRGRLGWLLGDAEHAPTFIAFLATVIGLIIGSVCLLAANRNPTSNEFWAKQADRSFTFASAALGFVFGRGSKST